MVCAPCQFLNPPDTSRSFHALAVRTLQVSILQLVAMHRTCHAGTLHFSTLTSTHCTCMFERCDQVWPDRTYSNRHQQSCFVCDRVVCFRSMSVDSGSSAPSSLTCKQRWALLAYSCLAVPHRRVVRGWAFLCLLLFLAQCPGTQDPRSPVHPHCPSHATTGSQLVRCL